VPQKGLRRLGTTRDTKGELSTKGEKHMTPLTADPQPPPPQAARDVRAIMEGEVVPTDMTSHGTPTGTCCGMPPTGTQSQCEPVDARHVHRGKITAPGGVAHLASRILQRSGSHSDTTRESLMMTPAHPNRRRDDHSSDRAALP
jgi:hypothetical protein